MNPWPPDTTPPSINILSPQNTTYTTSSIPLNFTVNESTSWMGYSLDYQANVTISGNTSLTSLAYGRHSIVVYANDTSWNMGSSDIVYFTITIIGDINGDFKVDISDLVIVISAIPSYPSSPIWNPYADLNNDSIVDIADLVITLINFGKTT
jgi:hypothetical protein